MDRRYTAQDWLDFLGKEKLQAFQDSFSEKHGVGLVFFDTDKSSLTVWSQEPLLCHEIKKENVARCQDEEEGIVSSALSDGELHFFTCPFGIMGFICPINFQGEIVAYAYCNGVADVDSKIRPELRRRFHLKTMNKLKFQEIGELLAGILALMDVNLSVAVKKTMDAGKAHNMKPDVRISVREQEIAELVCRGFTNKQIAEALFISETTVKSHVSSILTKLNLKNRKLIIVHYHNKEKRDIIKESLR